MRIGPGKQWWYHVDVMGSVWIVSWESDGMCLHHPVRVKTWIAGNPQVFLCLVVFCTWTVYFSRNSWEYHHWIWFFRKQLGMENHPNWRTHSMISWNGVGWSHQPEMDVAWKIIYTWRCFLRNLACLKITGAQSWWAMCKLFKRKLGYYGI